MSALREEKLQFLYNQLGYDFKNPVLLDLALSHSSWSYEQGIDQPSLNCNERLEFLGDSVLGLVISHYLYTTFPDVPEGELSRMRANLVNTSSLAECAQYLGVGQCLFLGKGEELQDGRHKVSILANALEAILAAIFLDGGIDAAAKVIKRVFSKKVQYSSPEQVGHKDHKSALQEKVQAIMPGHPQYKLLASSGPDHQKMFQVAVVLQGRTLATGLGRSKKEAEQEAAGQALGKLEAMQDESR